MGKGEHFDDQYLIRKFIEDGSDRSFEDIYRKYNKMIYNYVKTILYFSENNIIEEMISEIFLNVYLNINKLKDISKFKSWIYRIAHNLCVNYIRLKRRKDNSKKIKDEIIDKSNQLENKFINQELKDQIYKTILNFDDISREMVILKYYEQMTYEDISEIMNITIPSLKYRMTLALDELYKKLQKDGFLE